MSVQISRRALLAITGAAVIGTMSTAESYGTDFVPQFEFQKWDYQSYLLLPENEGLAPVPGNDVAAKKWARGSLTLADAIDELAARGKLAFPGGIELTVSVKFEPGKDGTPAKFEATGVGDQGVVAGVEYHLTGWAIPGKDGKLHEVRGAVRAAKAPTALPGVELGRMPIGTVGLFVISKAAM